MRTILLAGGYATRLHPITEARPKPLLPIAGKPLIEYILEDPNLPGRPIVSTNRKFFPHFSSWKEDGNWDVDLVVEESLFEQQKLGTIGAIAYVIEHCGLDEDILVIGGDNLYGFEIASLLSAYEENILIALNDVKDPDIVRNRYGVVIVQDGRITGFQEKPNCPRSTLASTACYIYPREVLPHFRAFAESGKGRGDAPGYFNEWCLKDLTLRMDAFVFDSEWFDVGDRASYIQANRHHAQTDVWRGDDLREENSEVDHSILLGQSTIIDSSLSGCVVDVGCSLRGVHLEDCLIGKGSILVGDSLRAKAVPPISPSGGCEETNHE